MGKFDGYLICSDIDGTFTGGDRTEENIKAVRYFNENGGYFTFATGRLAGHLREKGLHALVNCPACLCNGSVIYDYKTDRILREVHVSFSVADFLDAIKPFSGTVAKLHIMPDGRSAMKDFLLSDPIPQEVLSSHPAKLLCRFDSAEKADLFKRSVLDLPLFRNTCIAKSWSLGVEFNAGEGSKGHGLDFLKKHLGNVHTAIGIGDYENDLSLLAHADLGVAVANAIEPLKQQADMIVTSNKDAAIRDLIEKLESLPYAKNRIF